MLAALGLAQTVVQTVAQSDVNSKRFTTTDTMGLVLVLPVFHIEGVVD